MVKDITVYEKPDIILFKKDFTESSGIFKFRKRIIHGTQPETNVVKHNIHDPRLAQPIQLMDHSNFIYDASDLSNLNHNFVKQYLYKDGSNQVRQKNNLYLEIIQVQQEHQRKGVASGLLKDVMRLSKEKYNSKLTLNALPPGGTEGQIPSPSLAYWSKGFRFVDENANKQMLKIKSGEVPLTEAPCGFMFLDETISKI